MPGLTKYIILLPFIFVHTILQAQDFKQDTISFARNLIADTDFRKAEMLLDKYHQNHSADLETNWLLAYAAYRNGNFRHAVKHYDKAVILSPENNPLKMEFARTLFQINKHNKAGKILSDLKSSSAFPEAFLLDAYINFWYGNFGNVRKDLDKLKEIDPGTTLADELNNSIDEITALNLKTEIGYQYDNQPLKSYSESFEAGKFYSRYANLKLKIANHNYNPVNQAIGVSLSNRFLFGKPGLELLISAGVYKNFSDIASMTGQVEVAKKLNKNNRLVLGFEREPYVGTQMSTEKNVMQAKLYGAYDYSNNKLMYFHLEYIHKVYQDDNYVKTLSSWLLTRPFKINTFDFQVGVGLNYSDSKENLFEPAKAISEYTTESAIDGIYNPYFTPDNQWVNSALLHLNYKPVSRLRIALKTNYGFYAKSRNPYFSLSGDPEFTKGYADITFHPYNITGTIEYSLKKNMQIRFNYTNQETYYYNISGFTLGFNYSLTK